MNLKKKLGYTGIFLGTAFGAMHVINNIFSYIATADHLLEEDKYEYYDWRFGKIAYKKKGSGSPVLLIHNLDVCSSSHEWYKVEKELVKINTVYTIDLLGCGCSDRPILTYTNFLYVQLITDFIKHIIGQKTDVIVSCKSSSFVLMACSNDKNIINRVIMINPENLVTLAKIPTKRTKLIKYLLYMPVIGTFIYNLKMNKHTIAEHFSKCCLYDANKMRENDVLTCFEVSHKQNTSSKYLYACQESRYTNANVPCCLDNLENSIFIIVGNSNPDHLLSAAQYQNHLPSIEIVEIENAKLLPHVEKPSLFVDHVKILFSEEPEDME